MKTESSETFIRYPLYLSILEKVQKFAEESFASIVSMREPFALKSDFFAKHKKYGYNLLSDKEIKDGITVYGYQNSKRAVKYLPKTAKIKRREEFLTLYKAFIPKAYGCGAIGEEIPSPILGSPMSVCTETYYLVGGFKTKKRSTQFNIILED